MSNSTTLRTVLCRIDEIRDPGSRGVTLQLGDGQLDVLLVRKGCDVYAYLNSCPHTGGPLDWNEHEFLSLDKRYIQCATHAALFQISDGLCIAGPCAGDSLTAVPVEVEANLVVVSPEVPIIEIP